MTPNTNTKWYESWFDTSYYHLLYKDRDDSEAQRFIDKLSQYLKIQPEDTILDLACGKGRHSIYLNRLGYEVTGVDLSENSIHHAKKFENERLCFEVHDMTKLYPKTFDFVFNLFTSFGYFEDEQDNLKTIKTIKNSLKPNGIGVIDFLNPNYVIQNLVTSEVKTVEAIDFQIKRYVKDGFITKEINFEDNNEQFSFFEKVQALTLKDFKRYFEALDLELVRVFGDYDLNTFDEQHSSRTLMLFKNK